MENRKGRIIAQLASPDESGVTPEIIKLINRNISPPSELGAEDVFIRAMFVASDQVNSFGGKFPVDELEQLTTRLIDSPVMVGHRKDRLPIGRNFHAVLTERDSVPWVKAYFYWLKNSAEADQLKQNIDGGVYKECSIGFTFHLAECSICGQDIRSCAHEPFARYQSGGGSNETCCFYYRQIDKVLETSLVYRGAVPDTSITNELSASSHAGNDQESPSNSTSLDAETLEDLEELRSDDSYYVMPFYEGRFADVAVKNGQLEISSEGRPMHLPKNIISGPFRCPDFPAMPSLLVGYRGKERCTLAQLDRFLVGKSSGVCHLDILRIPTDGLGQTTSVVQSGRICIRTIRCLKGNSDILADSIDAVSSRDGVLLLGRGDKKSEMFRYKSPSQKSAAGKYILRVDKNRRNFLLQIYSAGNSLSYQFREFSLERLKNGVAFVAEAIAGSSVQSDNWAASARGSLFSIKRVNDSMIVGCRGAINGSLICRSLVVSGGKRYLISLSHKQNHDVRSGQ